MVHMQLLRKVINIIIVFILSLASQVATTMATFAAHESALANRRIEIRPGPQRDE